MADARSLTDLFGILGPRRVSEAASAVDTSVTHVTEVPYPTQALQKFLRCLHGAENPLILDLGPVVGSNVTFFGEQLGCRIRVEDVAADIDRHVKGGKLELLPEYFAGRFTPAPGSVDGILCWDILDYLDRPAAQALATALEWPPAPSARHCRVSAGSRSAVAAAASCSRKRRSVQWKRPV